MRSNWGVIVAANVAIPVGMTLLARQDKYTLKVPDGNQRNKGD